jgi:hypothetical protein
VLRRAESPTPEGVVLIEFSHQSCASLGTIGSIEVEARTARDCAEIGAVGAHVIIVSMLTVTKKGAIGLSQIV